MIHTDKQALLAKHNNTDRYLYLLTKWHQKNILAEEFYSQFFYVVIARTQGSHSVSRYQEYLNDWFPHYNL